MVMNSGRRPCTSFHMVVLKYKKNLENFSHNYYIDDGLKWKPFIRINQDYFSLLLFAKDLNEESISSEENLPVFNDVDVYIYGHLKHDIVCKNCARTVSLVVSEKNPETQLPICVFYEHFGYDYMDVVLFNFRNDEEGKKEIVKKVNTIKQEILNIPELQRSIGYIYNILKYNKEGDCSITKYKLTFKEDSLISYKKGEFYSEEILKFLHFYDEYDAV